MVRATGWRAASWLGEPSGLILSVDSERAPCPSLVLRGIAVPLPTLAEDGGRYSKSDEVRSRFLR
jgi:hypothetical protein